jgi:hypothetical protein
MTVQFDFSAVAKPGRSAAPRVQAGYGAPTGERHHIQSVGRDRYSRCRENARPGRFAQVPVSGGVRQREIVIKTC